MKLEDKIKRSLPQIFIDYFNRHVDNQVYYPYDNYIIDRLNIDNSVIEPFTKKPQPISYAHIYYRRKPFNKGLRRIFAISFNNDIYLNYLSFQYYHDIVKSGQLQTQTTFKEQLQNLNFLKEEKRSYGFSFDKQHNIIVRDIKDFYPTLDIKHCCKHLPLKENTFLNSIEKFYENLYEKACERFGLLQDNISSRLLSNIFLINIDKEITSMGVTFCRHGDAFIFPLETTCSQKLKDIDIIFSKYGLTCRENISKSNRHKDNTHIEWLYNRAESLGFTLFPYFMAIRKIRKRRAAQVRLLKEYAHLTNKDSFLRKALLSYSWDPIEIYHFLRWAVSYGMDVRFYYKALIAMYPKAPWYLRGQIRFLFLKEREYKLLDNLILHSRHDEVELSDYEKLKQIVNPGE